MKTRMKKGSFEYRLLLVILTLNMYNVDSQTLSIYGGPALKLGMAQNSEESIVDEYTYYNKFYDIEAFDKTFKLFEDLTKSNPGIKEDINYLKDAAVIRIDFNMTRCNVNGRQTCHIVLHSSGKIRNINGNIYCINKKYIAT
ncbi:MAG: hypothetical protein M0D57_09280 [Sphingobacteriales bacterium JAD_PAG50586_3]|nr:MAG: hypothetical protein M0D57_09280 [Sphingobacteriales bacterium JAD_PAG50586_3]